MARSRAQGSASAWCPREHRNVRKTIEFDPDTAEAIELLRREGGRGLSEAVNELIRRGFRADQRQTPYRPIHRDLSLRIDVSNVADAFDLLEGHDVR